ncbi:hypothetical protein NLU13_6296 [Sarocladium strictum]|uniref:Uncharacterized protein n=1 Tax=Sarocladium strictum TaxID=5046 RepID=A0AA39GFM1_SARSR|nr:hypothetical protein NLU13_6296 [Sarocladium strictum]
MPSRTSSNRHHPSVVREKPRRQLSSRHDFQPAPLQHHDRPKPLGRNDTNHSHYVNMLLSQDEIPKWHTIVAAICVWLLLAGFLVFPGTFTSLQETVDDSDNDNASTKAGEAILGTVKNIPLLVIGAVACGISAVGMLALLVRHRVNFVWLLNRLLIPGMANSLAGLISTLVGVYTQQRGSWSITAKVTAIIEGVYLVACAALFGFFTYKVTTLKKRHRTFYEDGGHWKGKTYEERKQEREQLEAERAALEPGASIV